MTATKWRRERRLPTREPHSRRDSLRRPAWYPIALVAVGVVAVVLGIRAIGSPSSSARTAKEIVTAERGVVQSTVTGSGDIAPAVDDSVSFQAGGTLKHLYVKQGDHVVKGQLLATLDPTSAQDTVDQAEQELTAAQDSLSAAKTASTSASTADSSTAVDRSADTAFVSYSPTSTTTTSASSSTTTTTTGAGPPATTTAPTHSTTTSPETTTVTVTAPSTTTTPSSGTGGEPSGNSTGASTGGGTDDSTGTGSDSGSASGSGTGSAQTTTSDPDTLAADIASAQAQVDSAEATLKSAETALSETKLHAPASGTVVSVEAVSPGDAVSGSTTSSGDSTSSGSSSDSTSGSTAGTTSGSLGGSTSDSATTSTTTGLVEIVNTHRMTVTVPFDESDISKLEVGQPATVTFDALTGVELAAKVSAISNIGTTSDSVVSYDATLSLTQHNAKVKPGMTASVAVIYKQATGVTLPNSAVTGTGNTATVNVSANGKTTPTELIVGVRGDSRTQIVQGLRAGQQVVVTETLPSTGTASSSGSSSSSGTLGGTTGGAGAPGGAGGFGAGGGFGGGAGRFGGG